MSDRRFHEALEREHKRELLASLLPGGSAARAIAVSAASVIEPRAQTLPCPQCGGQYRIVEHTRPVPGLRRVDVACRHCGTARALWFRIVVEEPN